MWLCGEPVRQGPANTASTAPCIARTFLCKRHAPFKDLSNTAVSEQTFVLEAVHAAFPDSTQTFLKTFILSWALDKSKLSSPGSGIGPSLNTRTPFNLTHFLNDPSEMLKASQYTLDCPDMAPQGLSLLERVVAFPEFSCRKAEEGDLCLLFSVRKFKLHASRCHVEYLTTCSKSFTMMPRFCGSSSSTRSLGSPALLCNSSRPSILVHCYSTRANKVGAALSNLRGLTENASLFL